MYHRRPLLLCPYVSTNLFPFPFPPSFRLRAGRVREDVWNWRYAVHHNIGFGGTSPMKM
jgi:hypothetical protein